ncbi:MAG: ornithine carbamoyltransferase [Planctomycetes bacterium]|nr:ornithine carbamoyltransferase [Planctomycetota bacterium]
MAKTDFINLADFTPEQLGDLLRRAIADKADFLAGKTVNSLDNKTLAMIFEKPSLRTRVSFAAAMAHLGGQAICLTQSDIGLGTRESGQDIARVLGRMCDAIMARTFSHQLVETIAAYSPVPVINALTDHSHPCQAMADVMTAMEHFGNVAGRTIAFIGDGNNVARSLAMLSAKLNINFVLACPQGYELEPTFIDSLHATGKDIHYEVTHDPAQAVAGADVVYTDTWTSMGQEDKKIHKQTVFAPFQINDALLVHAPAHAIVMHCLPAYRGYEITHEVMERFANVIFTEAENRLHFQRSLLNVLIAEGGF